MDKIEESGIPCYFCGKGFLRMSILGNHMRSHTKEQPFKCSICSKSFNYAPSCRRHRRNHPEYLNSCVETPAQIRRTCCYFCAKVCLDFTQLSYHLRNHTMEKPFKCEFCWKSFMFRKSCLKHEKSHQEYVPQPDLPKANPHSCAVSSKSFGDKRVLQRHVRIHREITYKCGICYELFKDPDEFSRHEKSHPEYVERQNLPRPTCDVCSKSFKDKRYLKTHMRIHTKEKPYKCRYCCKSFRHRNTRLRHEIIHPEYVKKSTKPTNHSCEVCSKYFRYKSNLKNHMRIHTGEKPFRCEVCAKYFRAKGTLMAHKKIHLSQGLLNPSHRPKVGTNPCYFCDRYFPNKSKLEIHLRSHTGEKPFKCGICCKSFSNRASCLRHEQNHVKKESLVVEKPTPCCYFCGKRGSRLSDLTRHMRIHTNEKPYRCDFCFQVFNDQSACRGHKKSHPEYIAQNPDKKLPIFSCYFCDKLLLNRFTLEVHMRTHTGERPFRCEFCSRSYCVEGTLRRHCKLHPEYILRRTLVPSYRKLVIYPCYFCGRLCHACTELEIHLRSHTGERPFRCGICCKSATDPALYSRHAKLHRIKRPEPCSLLERTF